nr:MAG TPA: hypothetical protein [Caudoviricetes sp.]
MRVVPGDRSPVFVGRFFIGRQGKCGIPCAGVVRPHCGRSGAFALGCAVRKGGHAALSAGVY